MKISRIEEAARLQGLVQTDIGFLTKGVDHLSEEGADTVGAGVVETMPTEATMGVDPLPMIKDPPTAIWDITVMPAHHPKPFIKTVMVEYLHRLFPLRTLPCQIIQEAMNRNTQATKVRLKTELVQV